MSFCMSSITPKAILPPPKESDVFQMSFCVPRRDIFMDQSCKRKIVSFGLQSESRFSLNWQNRRRVARIFKNNKNKNYVKHVKEQFTDTFLHCLSDQ